MARKEESYEWRVHALSERERELKMRLEQTEQQLAEERAGRAQVQAPLVEEARRLREALTEAEERASREQNEVRCGMGS
jgi:hypothetical protein